MSQASKQIEAAKAYFVELDGGRLPVELFTDDVEFYFPKFGVGRGLNEFQDFAVTFGGTGYRSTHHRDQLTYMEVGQTVVVEGTTEGTDSQRRTWKGGATPGGRFCSVFAFTPDGLIKRMYIYLDPDYTGLDKDRFHWRRALPRW